MFSLRPAVTADVPALEALAVAAYEKYVPRVDQLPAPMTADYDLHVRSGHVWVVVDTDAVGDCDAVVGLAVLLPREDHLLLDNVAVLPAMQGQGIGNRLLALAEDEARRRGLTEVRLYTNVTMTENLAYYPKRGYVETHRAQQHGFHRVFFRKPVTP
jgi:GNAT superfamily N-acetyltransferase